MPNDSKCEINFVSFFEAFFIILIDIYSIGVYEIFSYIVQDGIGDCIFVKSHRCP